MKIKALDRDARKRQILLVFAIALQNGEDGEMTINDIAKHLQLTASTKLRAMVMELVIDGSLSSRDEQIPGVAKFRRIYSPNKNTFQRPPAYEKPKRSVKVNSRQQSFLMDV